MTRIGSCVIARNVGGSDSRLTGPTGVATTPPVVVGTTVSSRPRNQLELNMPMLPQASWDHAKRRLRPVTSCYGDDAGDVMTCISKRSGRRLLTALRIQQFP